MSAGSSSAADLLIGRYRVHDEIAAGGMATVHLGRLVGDAGFSRTVAIKRLHRYHAKDPEIVKSFTDEARIAARIRHPNVVQTLDVIAQDGEVFLVMEYVHGEPLSRLIMSTSKRKEKIPPRIVAAILASALHGLHAAHEAKDSLGKPLGVVHRDISPQNIMVGVDGVTRVLDFGIARAAGRLVMTADGSIKGKIAYMAPEHLRGQELDRRADVHAAGVVLWEALTCKRLHNPTSNALTLERDAHGNVEAPSVRVPSLPKVFDEITLRALRIAPEERFPTALAMAEALENSRMLATTSEIAAWMQGFGDKLEERARIIERIENDERGQVAGPETHDISDEPTHDLGISLEKKPHHVESTLKISSTDLLRVALPPLPPPRESSATTRLPTDTVVLEDRKGLVSGTYPAPTNPAPAFVPAPFVPTASSTALAQPTNAPMVRPARAPERPAAIWLPWIIACIAIFIASGLLVALLMGN